MRPLKNSEKLLPNEQGIARFLWSDKWARTSQLEPLGDWTTWLFMAGRGSGKTRAAAEWIIYQACKYDYTRWAVPAPTFGDARDVCAEGDSGLLKIAERYKVLRLKNGYNSTKGEINLSNGSRIKLFSGDEPDRLRGPQHHGAWVDELASFKYDESWTNLQFGLRLGEFPKTIVTTTPKPIALLRDLLSRKDGSVAVTRGTTYDNAANLAATALAEFKARYEGTRVGRQELYGELLEEIEGALWTRNIIEKSRVTKDDLPEFQRIVVAIDPAVTSSENSDETGIVVCGMTSSKQYYVLDDRTLRATPDNWARTAVNAYQDWRADRIVAEINNGGDLVTAVLKQVEPSIPVKTVHASRGKKVRAEPITALYEQGRVHHVGAFPKLEDQLVIWTPDSNQSPDRLDALVWALTELSGGQSLPKGVNLVSLRQQNDWSIPRL